ncbi:mediator of RNA polymerase II transcription subunit 28 isoform X2 [Phlebotomus papatasi]|uniref:mediator of RNA polymerase II transcription subunit 28 isoform X2 n=1 Tax=Phlebotomus papatasi TaxID=29031 RepID=UPI00248433C5|nr:mediator of RNA polymerase II transcription subunit 28 isoform X2 [Phlebotomus papatasi]
MASSSNGNGNLLDEFEESFQACLHALAKEEPSTEIDKEALKLEVDQTTMKFIHLARQMEAFFLQKRFLLSALKPELVLKEENLDLRYEIQRKDELIRKHYEKIDQWKSLLMDQQPITQQGSAGMQGSNDMRGLQGTGTAGPMMGGGTAGGVTGGPGGAGVMSQGPPGAMGLPGMSGPMQAQQYMQQQQMQQMQMQVGGPQMYMQQGGPVPSRGGFNQASNMLHGPLAYLEKTTSNIDMVGMGDARR